jgi:hypothetical protein
MHVLAHRETFESSTNRRCLSWRVIVVLVALGMVIGAWVSGCAAEQQIARPNTTVTDRDAQTIEQQLNQQIPATVAAMVRRVQVASGNLPTAGPRSIVIDLAPLSNMAGLEPRRAERIAAAYRNVLQRAGNEQSVYFAENPTYSARQGYSLHGAMLSIEHPRGSRGLLLQMELTGPRRDGSIGQLWDDSLLISVP